MKAPLHMVYRQGDISHRNTVSSDKIRMMGITSQISMFCRKCSQFSSSSYFVQQ